MTRSLLAFAALSLALQVGCAAVRDIPPPPELPSRWLSAGLSVDEAGEVLRAALELAVVDGRLGGFSERPVRIPVLSVGVGSIPLPTFEDVVFFKASAEELQNLTDDSEPYIFYLDVRGAWREGEEVSVAIDRLPEYAEERPSIRADGSGITARFRKTPHGWQGKVQHAWTH